jgi:hypothetical protein
MGIPGDLEDPGTTVWRSEQGDSTALEQVVKPAAAAFLILIAGAGRRSGIQTAMESNPKKRKGQIKGNDYETEIKLNEGTHETLGNGGTDAQFRCRRHLCATGFRRHDGFGYGGEQHGPTNARHTCF